MKCKAIQFMRPNGRQVEQTFDLPDQYEEQYNSMTDAGCRFEAEELMTGDVSITISNEVRDVDQWVGPNEWAKVEAGHIAMLERGLWRDPANLIE